MASLPNLQRVTGWPRFLKISDAVQVFNDFKAELDQLRRILWFYIDRLPESPRARADTEQQDKRLAARE